MSRDYDNWADFFRDNPTWASNNQFANKAEDGAAIPLGGETSTVGLLEALILAYKAGAPAWALARGLRGLADHIDPPAPPAKKWWKR